MQITDRYSKFTRAISSSKAASAHNANIFFDQWTILYDILSILLTDNGTQIVFKFFETMCGLLGAKQLNTTAYHTQTNGRAERLSKTVVDRLRNYVAGQKHDWDRFVHPLTYAYNKQAHRSATAVPYNFLLARQPPEPSTFRASSPIKTDAHVETSMQKLRKRLEVQI